VEAFPSLFFLAVLERRSSPVAWVWLFHHFHSLTTSLTAWVVCCVPREEEEPVFLFFVLFLVLLSFIVFNYGEWEMKPIFFSPV